MMYGWYIYFVISINRNHDELYESANLPSPDKLHLIGVLSNFTHL